MFMGINQVAYDLLVENPMTGYMNEIIFTRVLGHAEIEEGAYWQDSTQCWLCQKWSKALITYHKDEDRKFFAQKLDQLEKVHSVVNRTITQTFFKRSKHAKKLVEFDEEDEDDYDVISPRSDNSYHIEEVPEEMELSGGFNTTHRRSGGVRGFGNSGMSRSDMKKTLIATDSRPAITEEG